MTIPIRSIAPAAIAFAIVSGCAAQCTTQDSVKMTFFGFPDNTPPSANSAYSCLDRNYTCGGTGTYADPLSFASSLGEFTECEIIYSPFSKKYLMMDGHCEACDDDWNSGTWRIDIWTGSDYDGGPDQTACEFNLTPDYLQSIVSSPDAWYNVDETPSRSNGQCNLGDTYDQNPASDYCASGSNDVTTPSAAPTQDTSCSWQGHCAGAPCTTFNDCSDASACDNGVCAAETD